MRAPKPLPLAAVLLATWLAPAAPGERGAQGTRPWVAHHAAMRTGALDLLEAGQLVTLVGIEHLPGITNRLVGVKGELTQIPSVALRLALAEYAEFRVSWPAWNRLRVLSQVDPPPLGHRLGPVAYGWGDVTVSTLMRIGEERGAWPAFGLKFAAKLPNSDEKLGIGYNTTDVFASVLLAKRISERLSCYTDLGLGILTDRTTSFTQHDAFTYGAMADWRVRTDLRLLVEVAGMTTSHDERPGIASPAEARGGVELRRGAWRLGALVLQGLERAESRGTGFSLHASVGHRVLGGATRVGAPGSR